MLWLLFSCADTPAPRVAAPAAAPIGPPPTGTQLEVVITAPPALGRFRWEAEVAGLSAALLESGLSELPGVVARVSTAPPPPGMSAPLRTGAETWTATLEVGDDSKLLGFQLDLCDPIGACTTQRATGSRDDVGEPVADLLGWAAELLHRAPSAATLEAWRTPVSPDPYAILVCGRSAATFYGILPPVEPERVGDKGADPITKAVYLDPGMGLAQWILGRREAARGEWFNARVAFTGATLSRPSSALFLADEAAALAKGGHPESALLTWTALGESWPGDPRFQLPIARVALAAGQPKVAEKVVRELSAPFLDEPPVVELAVRIADAVGPDADYDVLLARWAVAAPDEPEPVRRRISLRIRASRLNEAWDLLPELAGRGVPDEAARLAMALGVGIGRWEDAAAAANQLGLTDQSTRIAARGALEKAPTVEPPDLDALPDVWAKVAVGHIRFAQKDAAGALVAADGALALRRWMPEALSLRAVALRALGRAAEAAQTEAELAAADPDFR